MAAPEEIPVAVGEVDAVFAAAEALLRERYGARPGFELRDDLAWPKDNTAQRQTNLFVGRHAGLELSWRAPRGAAAGILVARARGFLEFRLKVRSLLVGAVVAIAAFVVLLVDGFAWNSFIAYSYRAFGNVLHGGAIVLYAFVPAVILGGCAGALGWASSWLVRPLVHQANRALGVETPAEFLSRLDARMRRR